MFGLPYEDARAFGGYRRFYDGPSQMLKLLNIEAEIRDDFRDKILATRKLLEGGVPVVPILGVVASGDVDCGPFRALTSAAETESFLQSADCPQAVFIKPSRAHGGSGAMAARRAGDRWQLGTDTVSPTAFAEQLWRHHADELIIQPHMKTHKALDEIGGEFGLATIRIMTANTRDGPEIFCCVQKLFGKSGLTDNFLAGRTGNWLSSVDINTGGYGPLFGKADGYAHVFSELPTYPATGAKLATQRLPHLAELRAAVCAAAALYPQSPILGFDVATTTEGVFVLEVNLHASTDLLQAVTRGGIVPMLAPILPRLDAPRDMIRKAQTLLRA